jgi:hypothetical protein
MSAATATAAPVIYSLAEVRRAPFPTPRPIVRGLFSEGETVLLIGKPKIGKSRLSQQLTICLSRGEPFLGHVIDEPCKVLYLDLENRLSGVQARFAAMSAPHPGDDYIYLYAPQTLAENPFVASSPGITELGQVVDEFRPDVLIIDPWRLFVGGDGNKEDVVMNGLKVLSELRQDRPNLTIILIHHLRKQQDGFRVALRKDPSTWVEAASGHYALIGHSDATYGLEREQDAGDELIVFGGIARTLTPPTLILDEDQGTLLFNVAQGAAAVEQILTDAERRIWAVAKTLGQGGRGFTFGELMTAVGTTNKKAVASTLRKAESVGLVDHQDRMYTIGEEVPR